MIRNTIFSIFFFSGIIIISIIFLPTFLLPQKFVLFGGKLMGYWTSFCLKFFLATKIIIKGRENIVNNEKFFIRTVEGLDLVGHPSFTVQFHPEACPGPHDAAPLFGRFRSIVDEHLGGAA